jgi:putative ABC transport system permease protein
MHRYVIRSLVRNPRRTLASLSGVAIGVGLFSGVLFFVDASAATLTDRAIVPLALDMQRVMSAPLGRRLVLDEAVSGPSSLQAGQEIRISLTVVNEGADPANEALVRDELPPPFVYVSGSTTRDGHSVPDMDGQNPLSHGLARTGLNLGTLAPGATTAVTYTARAARAVPVVSALQLHATVSSREDLVPVQANAPDRLTLGQLRARIARVPGVTAADELAFVDLPGGSLRSGDRTVRQPIRVFAFDSDYAEHYRSIRLTEGSFVADGAVLSAEASRALAAAPGRAIHVRLPGGGAALSLPVSGVADLGQAKALFYSRKARSLEDFIYVPNAVVISPATFERAVLPAFRKANAARGDLIRSEPVLEVDALVDRSTLPADPGQALARTKAVAASIRLIGPDDDVLIDNISNALEVARDDAIAGKRMFVFLGLPAALLAAVLAAYAGSVHAHAERREHATLRLHGAQPPFLMRVVLAKAVLLASLGALVGTALGYVSVGAILGQTVLSAAAPKDLVTSALIAVGAGAVTTALALAIPARRSLRREIAGERREIELVSDPAWRRWKLDIVLVAAAVGAEVVCLRAGAFDAPVSSVSAGETVSLPSYLLVAPMLAWFAGTLLAVRVIAAATARLPVPASPRFGPLVTGTLVRSLHRRGRELTNGIVGVGLVTAFGLSLALFAASYDAAKAEDARFTVGSDVRVTPSAESTGLHPREYARKLRVAGVEAVTPVVFKLDNAVLIGRFDQDRRDLAAIDPAGFSRVTRVDGSFVAGSSAESAMARFASDPHALLVDTHTVDDLGVEAGDEVKVLLARGTDNQTLETFRVVGVVERFPGFPQGVHLVANLDLYQSATGVHEVDFFLARTADHSRAGLLRAARRLESGPGTRDALNIETTETALNKDQSSLTALHVNGLVDLDSLYTLLMSVVVVAIFVFGLMLQRRREYVFMRAQGVRTAQIRSLILLETVIVVIAGLMVGAIVGAATAYFLVHILRPLFILDPSLHMAGAGVARVATVTLAATLASALAATALVRRLKPSELLRDA